MCSSSWPGGKNRIAGATRTPLGLLERGKKRSTASEALTLVASALLGGLSLSSLVIRLPKPRLRAVDHRHRPEDHRPVLGDLCLKQISFSELDRLADRLGQG